MTRRTGQNTSHAVMAQKQRPAEDDLFGRLGYFPTPPWATRALTRHVLPLIRGTTDCSRLNVAEPAAGEGHMAEVLRESFGTVLASDIHDYGAGYEVRDFLTGEVPATDWVITNPPFHLAEEFADRALNHVVEGVALLVRSVWAEGGGRYERLFRDRPPTAIAQFCERVPMVLGRWDPNASTATGYAWFVWCFGGEGTRFLWIPPGQRKGLTRDDDVARFVKAPPPGGMFAREGAA